MYVTVWEFTVRAGAERAFEQLYGPGGPWVMLFRAAPGYLGTELLRPRDGNRRYLTLDRWASRHEYEVFRRRCAPEYQRLDELGDALTETERHLGEFTGTSS